MFVRVLAKGKQHDRALLFEIARKLLINEYRDTGRDTARERPSLGRAYNAFEDAPYQGAGDRARLNDPDNDWGTTQSPTYTFEDSIFAAGFDQAVRVLEHEPRDAFLLTSVRGLTTREAGAILGTSHETARSRRDAAAADIQKELI